MKRPLESWLPRAAYPLVLALGIALYLGLLALGAPLLVATYTPVVLGMVAITGLEHVIPYRASWRAGRREVRDDALYLVLIQAALPRLLSFLAAVTLLSWLEHAPLATLQLWPAHLPIGAQVVVMLLAADLLRYGLHVLSHRSAFLWRLHAVHHSPERLYWLNVGRFHPLEKALQFLLDALPFLALGVEPDVLALYFVCYSLNGFFQHSNVALRLGPLNWIVSGPELHRWHHSRLAEESNGNYGNNLILWDVVFGTRFLPRDREVGELGLPRRDYPVGFLAQLAAPSPDAAPGAAPSTVLERASAGDAASATASTETR